MIVIEQTKTVCLQSKLLVYIVFF